MGWLTEVTLKSAQPPLKRQNKTPNQNQKSLPNILYRMKILRFGQDWLKEYKTASLETSVVFFALTSNKVI